MAEYDKILKGRKNPISGNMEAQLVPTIPPSQIDELDTRADELASRITAVEESGYGGMFYATNGELHYIKSIIVPDGTKKIGQMFKNYSEEHPSNMPIEIFVPEGVEEFGDNMLASVNMALSTDSINIPSTLKKIGDYAFQYSFDGDAHCFHEKLEFPEGLESIGTNAFYNLQTKHIIFPSTLTELVGRAFENTFINKMTFKPLISSLAIPDYFYRDRSYGNASQYTLKELELAEGTVSIGNYAFYCNNLKNITIPSTVTTIGDSAFRNYSSNAPAFESITIEEGEAPLTIGDSAFRCDSSASSYMSNAVIRIPARCTSIAAYAFNNYNMPDNFTTTIYVNKPEGSLEDAPWGAKNATVIWTG